MALDKCRQCGCMQSVLDSLQSAGASPEAQLPVSLMETIRQGLIQMETVRYACLGCEHCFPAVAQNAFNQAFPEAALAEDVSCSFEVRERTWPPVPGEYVAFCDGPGCPVAVSTLGSGELAEQLAAARPKELCIVGKTETENIGIDKIIKNTVANPTIRVLVLAGEDPRGHRPGATLLALQEQGVDDRMRVIGAPGKRLLLRNVTKEEVELFRSQIRVVDLIGCQDIERVVATVREAAGQSALACGCEECSPTTALVEIAFAPTIEASEPATTKLDRAGYFVIIPQPQRDLITVEHYSYENKLLRTINGATARSLYRTIIDNGWVTELSHAAYLGRELAKAELSIRLGFKYVHDGA